MNPKNDSAPQQSPTSSTRSSANFIPLEAIHVASPCKADWNKMDGDAQARFCGSCAKHVYNLSSMTRDQAEQLVAEKEGKLCVRFYQREDGTMLTSDCNVGVAALSVKLREAKFSPFRIIAIVACAVGALLPAAARVHAANAMQSVPLVGKIVRCIAPTATAGVPQMMGDVAPIPKPPQKPKAQPRMVLGEIAAPRVTSTPTIGVIAPPKTPRVAPKNHKATKKHVAVQKVGAKKIVAKKAALHKKKAR